MFIVIVTCVATAIFSLILTPFVRKFAIKIRAVDEPGERKINLKEVPTLGGLAVYLSFFFALFFILPIPFGQIMPIFLGATAVLATGIIDDLIELTPKMKMVGITLASLIIYFLADIKIDIITLPFIGSWSMGIFSLPVTVIWILAITNAVNLIDGLDGLATGVSMIALTTMGIIGYFFLTVDNAVVSIMIFVLVGALAGFLPYNFYPARIFLGDTGALFIGFMIAVMSLQGLKNATLITLIIPIVILGIPITDTIYAMIRRYLNKKPISSADKMHLHHQLMALGLTHRQAVLAIYCLAAIFSVIALIYPVSTLWGSLFLTLGLLFGLELFVESIGLVGKDSKPFLNKMKKFANNLNKKE
ncbi:glycosyltransferase family 4 protein [Carnobacterium sp.]|uniref:glycosyltransferase family 4 protein n=1 Tax=Carnobacterium sp. TaxID=48221 RepID=UPI003C794550